MRRICAFCGKKFTPDKFHQSERYRYCSTKCRVYVDQGTLPSTEESAAECRQRVEQRVDKGLKYVEEMAGVYHRFRRSKHADQLEKLGLPGHVKLAAKVLGICPRTLEYRLRTGSDLLRPLAPSRRAGRVASVELKLPDKLPKVLVIKTEAQIARDRLRRAQDTKEVLM